ncbi:hypothetical protein [Arsukibacterium perlucidum]|nr:hypothetical protein [Arsukibacterium perlucidum]
MNTYSQALKWRSSHLPVTKMVQPVSDFPLAQTQAMLASKKLCQFAKQ